MRIPYLLAFLPFAHLLCAASVLASTEPAVHDCDRLAAHPLDEQRANVPGVDFEDIGTEAVPACEAAVAAYPDTVRFKYQLGRALAANGTTDRAVAVYEEAANAGYGPAAMALGTIFDRRFEKSQERDFADLEQAFSWWAYAGVELGFVPAKFRLGQMYLNSPDKYRNVDKGMKFLKEAAASGMLEAQWYLGAVYISGEVIEQDVTQGATWMKRAAEKGSAQAQALLTSFYLDDNFGEQNEDLAFYWAERAADNGDKDSKSRVYTVYHRVLSEAVHDKLARLAGDSDHQFPRADIPTYGRKPEDVVEWIEKEANRGDAEMQLLIGLAYRYGVAGKHNKNKALQYVTQAADQDLQRAIDTLETW